MTTINDKDDYYDLIEYCYISCRNKVNTEKFQFNILHKILKTLNGLQSCVENGQNLDKYPPPLNSNETKTTQVHNNLEVWLNWFKESTKLIREQENNAKKDKKMKSQFLSFKKYNYNRREINNNNDDNVQKQKKLFCQNAMLKYIKITFCYSQLLKL